MATERWIGGTGQGLTFGNAFSTATLNSIANGNSILSDLQIDNSSNFDIFADVSFIGASVTTTGNPLVQIGIYPLLDDAATYGDGRFGSSAAGAFPSNYAVGAMGLPVGTQAITGMVRGIILPPAKFKFILYNSAGVAFAASGNTLKYRTYNRQVS